MKFGHFTLEILETGYFALDGGAMFGVVPKNLWASAYNPGDEENRIPMSARSLLVRSEDRIMLLDTGNGLKFPEKQSKIYKIDNSKHTLEQSLARFQLTPDDITDVILTHLHFDHAGGATILRNGKPEPAFPNATYHVQKEHLTWALKPADKDRASFIKENFEPLLAEGVLKTIEGKGELFPGISMLPVYGHTTALQMIRLESQQHSLLFAADLFPTAAHIRVPFGMAYDNHPLTTIEEKKAILPLLYEEKTLVCFGHDAFVQAATVISTEKGFALGEKVCITSYE